MGVLAWKDAVDIGHNRGRLAAAPAASLARVDVAMRSAFGRAADINEAWRSPEDADKNYRAYLRFLNGGPWAPIALPGDKSIHCFGYAVDTDDTSDAQMRIWNDHGWYWTVYRNGKLAERWHLEYFYNLDNHRNDPTPASTKAPTPIPEDDMLIITATKSSADGLIQEGRTFVNTLTAPLSILSAEEVNAYRYWAREKGIPFRDTLWTGDTIREVIRVRGLRPFDPSTGKTDYSAAIKY